MAKKTPRPGRTLLVFGLSISCSTAWPRSARRGSPVSGSTSRAAPGSRCPPMPQGGAITQTKLKQAASIVDARVNGSGVSEAEVSTQGNRNIIVEIPGKNASSLVDAVKRTAQLRFRIVAGQPQPGTPAPPASGSASPSGQPSPSGKATPSGKGAATKTPTVGKATPKPRPAPFAAASPAHARDADALERGHARPPRAPRSAPQPHREGCADQRPAGVVAEPRRRVAAEVRRLHLPAQGQDPGPRRGRPRPAADHLQRQGPEVPAVQAP